MIPMDHAKTFAEHAIKGQVGLDEPPLLFHPVAGAKFKCPMPRDYICKRSKWDYNPWTGALRPASALRIDPTGEYCTPNGEHRNSRETVEQTGIGDLSSVEPGTAARLNAGKPELSLIPLSVLANVLGWQYDTRDESLPAIDALECLGYFQQTHDIEHLIGTIECLGNAGWEECAAVFAYGRKKYASWNWAKGMPWSEVVNSAARHLLAMARGEETDSESGLPHRGHVFCNAVMLLQFSKSYPQGNDLPAVGTL